MDLMMTADDEIITFHDKTWDHLSNGTGVVRETTLEFMKNHIDVSRSYSQYEGVLVSPPSLDEVLSAFSSTDLRFNMEIKTATEDRYTVAERLCEVRCGEPSVLPSTQPFLTS